MPESHEINVLLVDDSAVVRQVLSRELQSNGGICVRTASDALIAAEKIQLRRPDAIILDIQMPRMDGLTFMRQIQDLEIPTIIFSSLAGSGSNVALDALEMGAVHVFEKPGGDSELRQVASELAETIRGARRVDKRRSLEAAPLEKRHPAARRSSEQIIVIGASTGGTDALKQIVSALPAESPGVLAVLHMPEAFTARYAERLNDFSAVEVCQACDGDAVETGRALIARGDHHLAVESANGKFVARVRKGPHIGGHRPSVDALFHSAARAAGSAAVGVLLTGMGTDGAAGLFAMRHAGAHTIAQDEATSVIYGMPREAARLGAAVEILPLDKINASCLRNLVR